MRVTAVSAAVLLGLGLTACSGGGSATQTTTSSVTASAMSSSPTVSVTETPTGAPSASATTSPESAHDMDGGPAPAGMKPAAKAKYPVGTQVTLLADHMAGMKGAKATVRGVYDTVTYAVDYTPSTGGDMIKDHKWVVAEELKGSPTTRLPNGSQVTILADHMPGMKGAMGTVVRSTVEPVYIVDYDMDGMLMRNHKWVVESEIKPAG